MVFPRDRAQTFDAICAASVVRNATGLDSPTASAFLDVSKLTEFFRDHQKLTMSSREIEDFIHKYESKVDLRDAQLMSFVTFTKMIREDPLFTIDEELPCVEKVCQTAFGLTARCNNIYVPAVY